MKNGVGIVAILFAGSTLAFAQPRAAAPSDAQKLRRLEQENAELRRELDELERIDRLQEERAALNRQLTELQRIEKFQKYLEVKKWIGHISYRQISNSDYQLGGGHHTNTMTEHGDIHFSATSLSSDGFTAHWVGEEESSEMAGRSYHNQVAGGGVTAEEFSDHSGSFKHISGFVRMDFAEQKFTALGGGGDAVPIKIHEVTTTPTRVIRHERDNFWGPSASVGDAMSDRPLPLPDENGLALIGGRTFVLPKYRAPDMSPALAAMVNGSNSIISVMWTITPVYEDLELVVDIDGYEGWIPRGTKHEDRAGNSLRITATLQNKDGSTTDKRAVWMKYELIRTSREPGVCLNWPEKPKPRSYDLSFPVQQPQGMIFDDNDSLRSGDRQIAQTVSGSYEQTKAVLECFDYGAWSTLRVTAKLKDGRVLVGHLQGNRNNVHITIPWRENGSLIAQAWKLNNPRGSGVADHIDAEQTFGSQWDVDGFSLYEEYRGFFMNGRHRRFDPSRKELCVLDQVKGATLRGFRIFENASHIKVKHEFRPGEVPEDRVVNRNRSYYSPKSSNEFQHALRVIKGNDSYASMAVREPGLRWTPCVGQLGRES